MLISQGFLRKEETSKPVILFIGESSQSNASSWTCEIISELIPANGKPSSQTTKLLVFLMLLIIKSISKGFIVLRSLPHRKYSYLIKFQQLLVLYQPL